LSENVAKEMHIIKHNRLDYVPHRKNNWRYD